MEAALYRPQTGYDTDPVAEDAALLESLSEKHPLIEGRSTPPLPRRTPFRRSTVFNSGPEPAGEAYVFIFGLCEAGTIRFDNPKPWLRRNVKMIPV